MMRRSGVVGRVSSSAPRVNSRRVEMWLESPVLNGTMRMEAGSSIWMLMVPARVLNLPWFSRPSRVMVAIIWEIEGPTMPLTMPCLMSVSSLTMIDSIADVMVGARSPQGNLEICGAKGGGGLGSC